MKNRAKTLPDEEMITEIDTNAPSCHMHVPDRSIRPYDQEYDGDNINERSYAGIEVEKVENTETNQITQPEIYSLRNRKVYNTMLVSNQINNYSNLSIKNLQATMTRDGYTATRKALRSHADICDLPNCYICTFGIEARGYKYCPTNISNTSLISNDIIAKPLHKTKKVVSFAKDTIFNFQANSALLNFTKLHQALAASSSLLETNML